jgi:hypothetical protein
MEKDISESIITMCEENGVSIVRGSKAIKKIKAFLRENGYSQNDIKSFFLHADMTLGSFDKLPKMIRETLANSAHFHIQEMNLLTSCVVRSLAYGPIFKFGGYLIHKGWELKERQLGSVYLLFILLGRKLIRVCRILSRIFLKLFRFTGFYQAPFPHMLWKYVNVDPWVLIQGFIQNIPVDPRLSPVFKCAKQGVISCGLVGIDFLPSRGKLYFLESNFNSGHYIKRHMLFPEGDTVCTHLVDWAVKNGFSKIIFFPHNFQKNFDKNLEDAWRQIAQKRGIGLEVVDDPMIGSPWSRSRRILMDCKSQGALYVNGRYLNSPLSRLIGEKGLLDQEIRRFNDSFQNDIKIPIPRVILSKEDLPPVDDETMFPNIIIKNAVLDQTKGIILYKSKQLPAEGNCWPNIAYEYVIPDLEVKEEQGVIHKYVYIFRAYLLITPDGPVYLGARKDVSSVAIPNALPFGIIKDKSPYITNIHLGADFVAHSEAEDQACKDTVLSIGMVVSNFLREKHLLILE